MPVSISILDTLGTICGLRPHIITVPWQDPRLSAPGCVAFAIAGGVGTWEEPRPSYGGTELALWKYFYNTGPGPPEGSARGDHYTGVYLLTGIDKDTLPPTNDTIEGPFIVVHPDDDQVVMAGSVLPIPFMSSDVASFGQGSVCLHIGGGDFVWTLIDVEDRVRSVAADSSLYFVESSTSSGTVVVQSNFDNPDWTGIFPAGADHYVPVLLIKATADPTFAACELQIVIPMSEEDTRGLGARYYNGGGYLWNLPDLSKACPAGGGGENVWVGTIDMGTGQDVRNTAFAFICERCPRGVYWWDAAKWECSPLKFSDGSGWPQPQHIYQWDGSAWSVAGCVGSTV